MKATDTKKKTAPTETPAITATDSSELGEVKIHENVIAALVDRAARSVEGVSRLSGASLVDSIAEMVGSRRMARSIGIEMDENNGVSIVVKLILLCGYTIPDVAPKVQRAVIEEIEKVTGMTVIRVNVVVQGMEESTPEEEEQDSDDLDSMPVN